MRSTGMLTVGDALFESEKHFETPRAEESKDNLIACLQYDSEGDIRIQRK